MRECATGAGVITVRRRPTGPARGSGGGRWGREGTGETWGRLGRQFLLRCAARFGARVEPAAGLGGETVCADGLEARQPPRLPCFQLVVRPEVHEQLGLRALPRALCPVESVERGHAAPPGLSWIAR